jgi:hypothetical protein
MLETIGSLLEHATPRELDDVFHALLTSVYLDGETGPVVAIEPKPFLKLLMDVSIQPFQPDGDGSGNGDGSNSTLVVEGDDEGSAQVVVGENRDTILADAGQEIVVADEGTMPVAPV